MWTATIAATLAVEMLTVLTLVNIELSREQRRAVRSSAVRAFVEFRSHFRFPSRHAKDSSVWT